MINYIQFYLVITVLILSRPVFSQSNSENFPEGLTGKDIQKNISSHQSRNSLFTGEEPGDALNERGIFGAAASDNFGNSVSDAGDVNGDGYDDIIVGAIFNDVGGTSAGRAYIYFGGVTFNAIPDVILTGDSVFSYFGNSVSSAGDVNGDGYDDVIVGAYRSSGYKGKAYIFYGGSIMNNIPDLILRGENLNDYFGYSVSKAGDVNGDGFSDVIVGAYGYSTSTGRSYIYYGGSVMNNTADVIFTGAAAAYNFGISVSEAGDVNGDGFSDVIIGSSGYSSNLGRAYLYYGSVSMNSTVDVIMTGQSVSSNFGISVSSAGDIDGNGYSDVIVGADGYSSNRGRAYIYKGGAPMNNGIDLTIDGENTNDNFGSSVSSAGDINGDGYSDVIISAMDFNTNEGKGYIYKGGTSMDNILDRHLNGAGVNSDFGSSVSAAGDVNGDGYSDFLAGEEDNDEAATNAGKVYVYFNSMTGSETEDFYFDGEADSDQFGISVASAGDVNGDGYDDIIAGARLNDANGAFAGRAYIYFGGANLDKTADVVMTGLTAGDQFGNSVSTAGDVNGDGYDDVIVGAPFNDAGGSSAGRAYIFYGGASMNNTADVILTGAAIDARLGHSVSDAGDVNGDGYGDVIVGAFTTENSYIYFGGAVMNNVSDLTLLGYKVSSAGDVNGDGFYDVITGDPSTTNGAVRIYFGGMLMNSGTDLTMTGENTGDNFGESVSEAGDVNGDGYDDVIAGGVFNDNTGINAGSSYIFYGGSNMNNISDVVLSGMESFDYLGYSVSSAGDLNNDGFGDVIVGALDESPVFYSGSVNIYYGGAVMDTEPDMTMKGGFAEDYFGWPCANAGDVNGDGKNDLIIGAYGFDGSFSNAGRVFLYRNLNPEVDPSLTSVKDVPFDQGGKIKLKWLKSGYDTRGLNAITNYLIYRSDPPGVNGYEWEQIGNVAAALTPSYYFTANTNYDSSGNSNGVFYFKVAARTENIQEIWESNIMSGYSVDNLAPFAPQNLAASPDNNSIYLTWNENEEEDFHHYIIYRNGIEYNTVNQNFFDDEMVLNDSNYIYRIAAVDVHGNISQLSNPAAVAFNGSGEIILSVIVEGFYNAASNNMFVSDTAMIYLRVPAIPYTIVDSSKAVIDAKTFSGNFPIGNAPTGNYYIVIKHRNSIETWSSNTILFTSGSTVNYSFVSAVTQAYGNNMLQADALPVRFAIYSGDVNQDGTIDLTDGSLIDNDAFNFASGYLPTDLNGDDVTDLADAVFADNNGFNFVSKITP